MPLLVLSNDNMQEQCECFYDFDILNVSIIDDKLINCLYSVYKKIYNDSISYKEIKRWIDHSIGLRHFHVNKAFRILEEQNNANLTLKKK